MPSPRAHGQPLDGVIAWVHDVGSVEVVSLLTLRSEVHVDVVRGLLTPVGQVGIAGDGGLRELPPHGAFLRGLLLAEFSPFGDGRRSISRRRRYLGRVRGAAAVEEGDAGGDQGQPGEDDGDPVGHGAETSTEL